MDATTTLAAVAVVLLALLVGVAIPVMLQAWSTLRSARRFVESTSTKLDLAIGEMTRLTARVNRIVDEVEGNLPRVQRVLEATDGLADSVTQVRNSLRMATAIAPAAFAAGKAIFASIMAPRGASQEADRAAEVAAESEGMTRRAEAS